MATHDMNLANASGAAFRTDLNNALSAIATNNSNSSDPATTFASQYFADTSNSLMKLRNTSNNAYVNLFTLAGGPAFSVDGTINSVNIGKGANSVAGNTVLGEGALDASVSGANNTAIGKDVLTTNTSGANNTAVGKDAMKVNDTGVQNVAVGAFALDANSSGGSNTALGYAALDNNTTASNNTAVGNVALTTNTTGTQNNAFGVNALTANQTGDFNVAMGTNALSSNTTADNNTAIGRNALLTNTTGTENTGVGSLSLETNSTGAQNTAVGSQSLQTCSTGSNNAAFGREALHDLSSGEQNTGLGRSAGEQITTGDNNLCLGFDAGRSNSPSGALTSDSNVIVLGNNSITSFYAKISTIQTSDIRDKTDVTDFKHGLSWITKLRPVTYRWDMRSNYDDGVPDGSKKEEKLHLGFIAQEELEIEKEHGFANNKNDMLLANENADGNYGMYYDRLVPILVNAIKELSAKVTALEAG